MTPSTGELAHLLPGDPPDCDARRLFLYGFRRIAAHGFNDAQAAHALLTTFGRSYRRPLVLLRAFAAELSRVSSRKLLIAPCCCPRTTAAEATVMRAVAVSLNDPRGAHATLAGLLGVRNCIGALTSAQALASAFADLGRPLTGDL